eukprot:COSAG01_NODE_16526_length_1229_cov_1.923894_1_plen_279_part_10
MPARRWKNFGAAAVGAALVLLVLVVEKRSPKYGQERTAIFRADDAQHIAAELQRTKAAKKFLSAQLRDKHAALKEREVQVAELQTALKLARAQTDTAQGLLAVTQLAAATGSGNSSGARAPSDLPLVPWRGKSANASVDPLLWRGVAFMGEDVDHMDVASVEECVARCQADPQCHALSFNENKLSTETDRNDGGVCWMKSGRPEDPKVNAWYSTTSWDGTKMPSPPPPQIAAPSKELAVIVPSFPRHGMENQLLKARLSEVCAAAEFCATDSLDNLTYR